MNNKKINCLKLIILNIVIILIILLCFEIFFLILKTKEDIEYDYKINNKNFELKAPKLSLKKFVKYMLFEMNILYFYDANNYFEQEEFRKPSVGKNYKNEDIIIAGCSFAHGASLKDNETVSAILAKKFPKYKVYNIGISGGSPRENLFILRNSQKFKNWGILPDEKEDTKFFIYVYFRGQKERIILTIIRPNSPHYKVTKLKNGEQKLDFYIPKNNIRKTFIYKYTISKLTLSDTILENFNGLLHLYFKEIQKEIKTKYPNSQFVIYIYDYYSDLNNNDIKNLEKEGIKVIISNKNYNEKQYLDFDNQHPNGRAWEEITDYLGKELNF